MRPVKIYVRLSYSLVEYIVIKMKKNIFPHLQSHFKSDADAPS